MVFVELRIPDKPHPAVCEDPWLTQQPRIQPEYTLVGVNEGVRLDLDFGFGRQIQRGAERKVKGVGVNDPGWGAVDFFDVSGKAFAVVFQQLRVADFLLGMGALCGARSGPSLILSWKQAGLCLDKGIGREGRVVPGGPVSPARYSSRWQRIS